MRVGKVKLKFQAKIDKRKKTTLNDARKMDAEGAYLNIS